MRKYIIFIIVSLVMMVYVTPVLAQSKNDRWHIRQGNRLFRQGRVDDAATEYLKAVEIDSLNPQALYNRGRAILQKGIKLFPHEQAEYKSLQDNARNEVDSLFQQASIFFVKAAKIENNPIRRAMSWHNIGWALQKQEKLQDAVEAYKEALRNNPHDEETRYNLALCQWQLKKQQDKNDDQQNQNNQQDNKDKNQNQDQQQNQDKNKDQQQNQDKQNNQDNNQDKDKQQNQQGGGQQNQPQMSEQNMQRMLDAVNRKEQETQEKLERAKSARQTRTLDKNW